MTRGGKRKEAGRPKSTNPRSKHVAVKLTVGEHTAVKQEQAEQEAAGSDKRNALVTALNKVVGK
jgi:hypothetical protein